MASPFAVFRRNQRMVLAVIGVLTMLVFVVGDPISRFMGRGSAPENPLFVKTNYGDFDRQHLDHLVYERRIVEIFLQRVAASRVMQLVEQKLVPPARAEDLARRYYESWYGQLLAPHTELAQRSPDAAAIEAFVLAKRAEQQGIVVSDQTVNGFLKLITDNAVPREEMAKIITNMRTEGRGSVGEGDLFDALRNALLSARYGQMFRVTETGIPPAQRWDYFEQLNQRASAQLLAVPVAGFLKEVSDPSEDKLVAFFERFENRIADPNSPEPGFKEPARSEFQYFKAPLDEYIAAAKDEVTEDEIKEYYEKNKEQFRVRELPPAGDDHEGHDHAGHDHGDMPAADGEKSDAEKTDGEKAAAPESDAAPAEPASEGDAKKSSQRLGRSPFRLVALNADEAAAEGKEQATAEGKEQATAEGKEQAAAEGNKQATAKSEDKAAGESAGEKAALEKGPEATTDDKPAEEPKYEPLEKVTDQIRKTLAEQKARQRVDQAFQKLGAKVREYGNDLSSYEANKEDNPSAEAPKPLDLAALAKEFGVTAHETELITPLEAQTSTDLGKSYNILPDQRSMIGMRKQDFVEFAFGEREEVFRPAMSHDDESNWYLSWLVKKTPEAIPDFKEARGKVLKGYKMLEARELARKQAEAYAKEAREAKKPLAELFGDRPGLKVYETGPFTWMTTGNTPFDPQASRPRVSVVNGAEAAGEEFMKAVFRSSPGDVTTAMNQPHTIAYVIEVLKFDPPREQLEQEFIRDEAGSYLALADVDQGELFRTWLASLEQEAGVRWMLPPRLDRRVND